MNIVINCWILRNKNIDGIGYFTINTVQRIAKNNPTVNFILLCDKGFTESYFNLPNVTIRRIFPPYRHPLLYIFYLEVILPFQFRKLKADLFLGVEGFLSLSSRYCSQVPVFHDLNFEHYPANLAWKNRLYFRFFFKRFAKKAVRIVTVSEYSKADINRCYHVPLNRIDNVSNGINSIIAELPDDIQQETREKYTAGAPFFLFVGSVHPRKNILRLLNAFDIFKKRTNSDLKLVIAGAISATELEILRTHSSYSSRDEIIFTGRLPDEELKLVFGSAYALTFVPIFEGFGIPIIEAFEAGVPVLTSNTSSLPEVAGNAAVYADPFNIESIAEGLFQLYEDKDGMRKKLVAAGVVRKQQFSWDRTASLLWESMKKAIHEK